MIQKLISIKDIVNVSLSKTASDYKSLRGKVEKWLFLEKHDGKNCLICGFEFLQEGYTKRQKTSSIITHIIMNHILSDDFRKLMNDKNSKSQLKRFSDDACRLNHAKLLEDVRNRPGFREAYLKGIEKRNEKYKTSEYREFLSSIMKQLHIDNPDIAIRGAETQRRRNIEFPERIEKNRERGIKQFSTKESRENASKITKNLHKTETYRENYMEGRKKIKESGVIAGENNTQSKLKNSDINPIRKMLMDGIDMVIISKKYNVSQQAIFYIKTNKHYQNVKCTVKGFEEFSKNIRPKIVLEDSFVKEIRKILKEGKMKGIEIEKKFNISHHLLNKIKFNKGRFKNI